MLDFRPIERDEGAFQQPVTAGDITTICTRVYGAQARVISAIELGGGMYNNTYRLALVGLQQPVVLRVAPAPERQFSSERTLMRNEYASIPYLAALAPLMPGVIAADWSHEVIGRDYMLQSLVMGVPAPEQLGAYPRSAWSSFFGQMGTIARTVHQVRGPSFGPVIGPAHASWSGALIASLEAIAADLDSVGLAADDIRTAAGLVSEQRAVLDEIREPRLLTGDLWTVNVMLDATAPEPAISGVLDMDRTWWGDPAADWTIRMALAKNDERTAFWDSYGQRETSPSAAWRAQLYEVRHLGSIRLERHRLGNAKGVADSYDAMAATLRRLNR